LQTIRENTPRFRRADAGTDHKHGSLNALFRVNDFARGRSAKGGQTMAGSMGRMRGMVFVIAIAAMPGWAAGLYDKRTPIGTKSQSVTCVAVQQEPTYMGKPLSYWLRSIRNRDEEMELAFDAIRTLGPEAQAAVPELTRIVAEPFMPVQIGVDERDLIISKLLDIQLRAEAIDALAAIGEAAAPSSLILIQWALTVRVIPGNTGNIKDETRFIDLVAMDILERMRVAGAIAQFGRGSILALAELLVSSDAEGRKLAVAVLSEKALPIAASLLKSQECEDRKLGVAILVDMWPVVARDHLIDLKNAVVCDQK
jgi:hypothetical protein